MSEVELRIAADPALVRTARQVAVALGRRVELDDEALDEVRLAVGEAAGLAVALVARPGSTGGPRSADASVVIRYLDEDGLLVDVGAPGALPLAQGGAAAEVVGTALAADAGGVDGRRPVSSASSPVPSTAAGDGDSSGADVELDPTTDGLTASTTIMVLSTLAPSSQVSTGPEGLAIRLHWPR